MALWGLEGLERGGLRRTALAGLGYSVTGWAGGARVWERLAT